VEAADGGDPAVGQIGEQLHVEGPGGPVPGRDRNGQNSPMAGDILLPLLAQVLLTFVVWLRLHFERIGEVPGR
jgi:hypothetical protein